MSWMRRTWLEDEDGEEELEELDEQDEDELVGGGGWCCSLGSLPGPRPSVG